MGVRGGVDVDVRGGVGLSAGENDGGGCDGRSRSTCRLATSMVESVVDVVDNVTYFAAIFDGRERCHRSRPFA